METAVDPGKVILDQITALEVERARVEARIASHVLSFQDLRRREAEAQDNPVLAVMEASFAADELAVALHQPTRTVQCRLAETRRVRNLLPKTWAAFQRGEIDAYRVSLVASALAKITDQRNHATLDDQVGVHATAHTTSQLSSWLKRFVAKAEPDQADARAKDERSKRSVWMDHQDDGMTFLHAYLSTTDAVQIDALLTSRARTATRDGRTFDQVRADELVNAVLGSHGSPVSSRAAVIGITIPATSLAGVSNEPGTSFDGSFALPADLVKDLARQPGTLFHRLITDPLGRILDITELGRFPTHKLRLAIAARDGTCRFPTCDRPVLEGDLDHHIPHPDGPTTGSNLRGLCRRHHRFKTFLDIEPTRYRIRPHTRSAREHDLTSFLLHLQYDS